MKRFPLSFASILIAALLAACLTLSCPADPIPLPLNLIGGNANALIASTGETTGTISAAGTTVTYSVSVMSGLMYGVELFKGSLSSVTLTLDTSSTSGALVPATATKTWYRCTQTGTLLISVISGSGAGASGDYTLRVLQTNTFSISGTVSNTASLPTTISTQNHETSFGDGAWRLDYDLSGLTNPDGTYTLYFPAGWSGYVYALPGGTALPLTHRYMNLRANFTVQNFDFTPKPVTGKITLSATGLAQQNAAVSASLLGGTTQTLTDSSGAWTLYVPNGWTGNVAPALSGYAYTPDHYEITNSDWATTTGAAGLGLPNINFLATALIAISGKLTTENTDLSVTTVGDQTIRTSNGGYTTVTDTNGAYTLLVPPGWSGHVYADAVRPGNYFPSPLAVSVSNATANTTLSNIVLKKYKNLSEYYDIVFERFPLSVLQNYNRITVSESAIHIQNFNSASDELKISRKKKAVDFPPIGEILVTTASLFNDDGTTRASIVADGGISTFYTEGSVITLAAGSHLDRVTAAGSHINNIITTGSLGSVSINNTIGINPSLRVTAAGPPLNPKAKPNITLTGVTLAHLYAPLHTFNNVRVSGKKIKQSSVNTALFLPGNIYANGFWSQAMESAAQHNPAQSVEDNFGILARHITTLGVTEGSLFAGSVRGEIQRVSAQGSRFNDASVSIAWMDTQYAGKCAINVTGGDLYVQKLLAAGGFSSLSATPVTYRYYTSSTNSTILQSGGYLFLDQVASGLGIADISLAKNRSKGNIDLISGGLGVWLGAIQSGAAFDRTMGVIKPRYFALTGKVAYGAAANNVSGSFYANGDGNSTNYPVFSPALTTAQKTFIWLERPAILK